MFSIIHGIDFRGQSIYCKKTTYSFLVGLMIVILSACGPSQAELDATTTKAAVSMFATQTAKAPTATQTPTNTSTLTNTPTTTPKPKATDTPTNTPSPTTEINFSPEQYPTPTGLSHEGQEAYNNIAHVLLTTDEMNAIFDLEEDAWVMYEDSPGLWMICRTFIRPDGYIHRQFFNCVARTIPGFDLETDDIGLYEVEKALESAYEFEYPQKIYSYFTESGRLGIDHLVQIDDFVYITGLELVTPLGTSFDDMFSEYEDRMLYESLRIMVARAEANPPKLLDFPEDASSQAGNSFSPFLVNPSDLETGWFIGENDEIYDNDIACRMLYHEEGPPPLIYNCIGSSDYYNLEDQINDYAEFNYFDITQKSQYRYEDPHFILVYYLDNIEGNYPWYSISLERNGHLFIVDLINPYLPPDMTLEESFTPEIDDLINSVMQMNLLAHEKHTSDDP